MEFSGKAFLAELPSVVYNASKEELIQVAIERGEGTLAANGAMSVRTGKHTGRSPKDKFIVDDGVTHEEICWSNNQRCTEETFEKLYKKMMAYGKEHTVFVTDVCAGADEDYALPVRFINECAWQQLFIRQLFIEKKIPDQGQGFTVISMPSVQADPEVDGTHSETFIILNLTKRMVLIGGGLYAGELKKSIFSVMNYLMPKRNVLSMHCSANMTKDGDTAIFFGLSGTGKTTLSADPNRGLIGDDEHVWTDKGIFNIEGGCYAKCIGLTEEAEPYIFRAIRDGAVLENVVLDEEGQPDYHDTSVTENTRTAYPVEHIENAVLPGIGNHPKQIVFLTADAFGVLPPISRLTKEQAMYYFLAGYTSKVAGTERGIVEPQATFSTAFGEPFLPLSPLRYAELLGQRIDEHQSEVYMLNTGWIGGPYGVGSRIKLSYTRALLNAALTGAIQDEEWEVMPVFGLAIPKHCAGVPDSVLNPRALWEDEAAYDEQRDKLAQLFIENNEKFATLVPADILQAGPKRK